MSAELCVRVRVLDIPPREGRRLLVGGREIAVFNLGDRFLTVDNQCPHKSGPLSDGIVAGNTVVCPLHAWKINLESGAVERPSGEAACVQAYETRTDGDFVVIDIPTDSAGTPAGHTCGSPAAASIAEASVR